MSNEQLALRVAILKVLTDFTAQLYKEVRAEIAPVMARGDRLMARSPLDANTKLGAVTLTDPKPVARVTDRAAFEAWVTENYPGSIERDYEIIGSHQEVAAVLWENAPQLLKPIKKVDPGLEAQIRTDSQKLGAPIGPNGEADVAGVSMFTPEAMVTCKMGDNALANVIDLFRSNKMTFDSVVFPELPGGVA